MNNAQNHPQRSVVLEASHVVKSYRETGNLDHETASQVFTSLLELAHTQGTAVVIVTHDRELARRCDRAVELKGGVIVDADRF